MVHGTVHFVRRGPSTIVLARLIARYACQARMVTSQAYPTANCAIAAVTAMTLDQLTVRFARQVHSVHGKVPSAVHLVILERFHISLANHSVSRAALEPSVGQCIIFTFSIVVRGILLQTWQIFDLS